MTPEMKTALGLDFSRIMEVESDGWKMLRVIDIRKQIRLSNSTVTSDKVHPDHKRLIVVGVVDVKGRSYERECWFVTEAGLYQLILHNNSLAARQIRNRISLDILAKS